jgi:hypothetical protein
MEFKHKYHIKRNIEALLEASKKVCIKISAKKIRYMFMSHHQNAGQNHNLLTDNISFENMEKFEYTGTTEKKLHS